MKHSVAIKAVVTVRVDDIEADTHAEAAVKAVEYYENIAHEIVDHNNTRGGCVAKIRHTEHAEDEP